MTKIDFLCDSCDLVECAEASRCLHYTPAAEQVKQLLDQATDDELIASVKDGPGGQKTLSTTDLAAKTGLSQTQASRIKKKVLQDRGIHKTLKKQRYQQAAERRKGNPPAEGPNWTLHNHPIQELHKHTPPEHADLIFTDPPYEKNSEHLYTALAEYADHALKPTGILAILTGNAYLPTIIQALQHPNLHYQWTDAYLLPGANAQYFHTRRFNQWKPILTYTKTPHWPGEWLTDTITPPALQKQENTHHPWQQQLAGTLQTIQKYAQPGHHITDPFAGSGTTLIAALQHNCHTTGTEPDPHHHQTATERIKTHCSVYQAGV